MRSIFLVAGVLGGVIPATAQAPSPNLPPTVRETVTVTATLEEETVGEVPASVDVITAEEIEARGATAISDLLVTVPGLSVVRSGGPGQVVSLFSRGTESDHTLVLWNGIELNDPYFGGFNWAFLPTEGVAQVEVARGPFSALYGSDALGGVVQVLSAPLEGVSLRLESGENGYGRGALTAGWAGSRGRLEIAAHTQRGDGELANASYDSDEVVVHASTALSPDMTLGLVARVNDSTTGIPLSLGAPSLDRRIAWRETEFAVPFTADLDGWRVDARISQVDYQNRFRDPGDAFGFTSADTDSEALRARTVASFDFAEGSRLSFGAEAERLEVSDRSVFGVNLASDRQETWAVFAETALELGRVRIDLGARHDDNDVYGSRTTPKLSLSTRLGESARVWASYGEGFRAPSVGELFFPFTGSRELKPEQSESIEVGLERRLGRWSARLTGFENRLTDLIDFDFATFRNVNVGRARTRGLEASVAFAGERLEGRWNATSLDTEDRATGLELLRRPSESSNLVLTARRGDWRLNLTGSYVGARSDVDPVTFVRAPNGSYTRLDLAATWKGPERFSPYLRLENALDREYAEALGFPAPGRTVILGLALEYR